MKAFDRSSIVFFETQDSFRNWLEKNHDDADELLVGFYKKATKIPSITWPQSVDEALCFGWIDGIRRSLGEKSYCIRFTQRRKNSHWSAVNLKRIGELIKAGKVEPKGMKVFEERKVENSGRASYEQKNITLSADYLDRIKANTAAWKHFTSKPNGYRKQCAWWIMSAKKEATRDKRLQSLITSSENGKIIPPLKWTKKK